MKKARRTSEEGNVGVHCEAGNCVAMLSNRSIYVCKAKARNALTPKSASFDEAFADGSGNNSKERQGSSVA